MVATLTTSGTSWTVGNERSYDVWGSVRSGATTGGPKGRYVANLGHVQDDESGLIYMRARYYEPASGRFINQDPARDGYNWYSYTRNNPINLVDRTGESPESDGMFVFLLAGTPMILMGFLVWAVDGSDANSCVAAISAGLIFYAIATTLSDLSKWQQVGLILADAGIGYLMALALANTKAAGRLPGVAGAYLGAMLSTYALILFVELNCMAIEDELNGY